MFKHINWRKKISNKSFWITLVPAGLLLIQTIAAVFGFKLDLSETGNRLLEVTNSAFALLTVLGVVNNPNTPKIGD